MSNDDIHNDTSTPWSGPAVHQSNKRKSKEKKRFARAMAEALEDFDNQDKIPNSLHADRISFQECCRRIAPYDAQYQQQCQGIHNLHLRAGSQGQDVDTAVELWLEVNRQSRTFVRDVKQKMVELDIHDKGFVPGYLLKCSGNWPSCLEMISIYHRDYDELTKDRLRKKIIKRATEAIRLSEMHHHHDSRDPVSIGLLFLRGKTWYLRGKLRDAQVDLRAVCSKIRSLGMGWNANCQPTIQEASSWYLYTLCKIKKRSVPRPHFSPKEKRALERELGLGAYERSVYKCAFCDKKAALDVHLQCCSRCLKRWYCSKDCQVKAWNTHKVECKRLREPVNFQKHLGIRPQDFSDIADMIQQDEVSSMFFSPYGDAILLMYDEQKQEYYDALTDAVVPPFYTNLIRSANQASH